jgi:mono/diheme cytochrome c family protein
MPSIPQANLKKRKILFASLVALACVALLYAILDRDKPWVVPEEANRRQNPLQSTESNLKSARAIYTDECAQCHGDRGKGDGPEAHLHDPAPSDLTDARHMNSITDGEIFYQITQGRKPMPSYKRRLTDEQRWQLVLFVRTFSASAAPK